MTRKDSEELTQVVGEFLHMIKSAADLKAIDTFVELDLTITQVHAIFLLAGQDHPLLISEVADRLHLSAATAGRTVDRLTTLGIVDRSEDPDDRRSKRVSLTPTGQHLADTQRDAVLGRIRDFSEALPAEVAGHLLDALRTALDATPDRARPDSACTSDLERNTK